MHRNRFVALSIMLMFVISGCFGLNTTRPGEVVDRFLTTWKALDQQGMLVLFDHKVTLSTHEKDYPEVETKLLPREEIVLLLIASPFSLETDDWTPNMTLTNPRITLSGNEAVVEGKFNFTATDGKNYGTLTADLRVTLKRIGDNWLINGLYIMNADSYVEW